MDYSICPFLSLQKTVEIGISTHFSEHTRWGLLARVAELMETLNLVCQNKIFTLNYLRHDLKGYCSKFPLLHIQVRRVKIKTVNQTHAYKPRFSLNWHLQSVVFVKPGTAVYLGTDKIHSYSIQTNTWIASFLHHSRKKLPKSQNNIQSAL